MVLGWQAMEMRTHGNSNSEHYDVLNNVLPERYSCRGFLSDCMPRATIERILVAAQRTASWCNAQPWQIAILTGAATIRTGRDYLSTCSTFVLNPISHGRSMREQLGLSKDRLVVM